MSATTTSSGTTSNAGTGRREPGQASAGAKTGKPARLTMAKALNAGLRQAMQRDPKVLLMGQDIGRLGGVFRVTDGLQADFGDDRVVDAPLAEAGILGTAIGLALRGYRTVCEIQFDGFVFPAYDQIVNQLAKMRFRSQGRLSAPVVVRIPFGGGIGAVEHHSESPEALFTHVAGLRVVACSNAADAYWMIQQAIAGDDPVIFFEPKRRYHERGDVDLPDQSDPTASGRPDPTDSADSAVPGAPLPLSAARVVTPGTDATLITYGPLVSTAVQAAQTAAEEGHSVEVVDLRSLSPLDSGTLYASARKTGRVIVVHEAQKSFGLGAEIAARITEECFYHLEAPVLRVTGLSMPYPPARAEDDYLPDLDRVLDGLERSLAY